MEAPLCRTCGKRHWTRACPRLGYEELDAFAGSVTTPVLVNATPDVASPATKPVAGNENVSPPVACNETVADVATRPLRASDPLPPEFIAQISQIRGTPAYCDDMESTNRHLMNEWARLTDEVAQLKRELASRPARKPMSATERSRKLRERLKG